MTLDLDPIDYYSDFHVLKFVILDTLDVLIVFKNLFIVP